MADEGFEQTFPPRPQTSLAYIRGLLEDCAKETTEEYQRLWPHHATVTLDAADARLLLAWRQR